MSRVGAFVRLTRPVFLAGGALLFALGAAMAEQPIGWGRYAVGQAMVTAVQLAAQYANEFYDLDADHQADGNRTWFSGGSGVLPSGALHPSVALRAAWIATAVSGAAIAAAALVHPMLAVVGVAGLAGAWAYSAPPLRLVATPFGVTAASTVVAVMVPTAGILAIGSAPPGEAAAVLGCLFFLHHAMLVALERPDRASDARAAKRTLSVRIGARRSAVLHGVLVATAFGVLVLAAALGALEGPQVAWAALPALVGVRQVVAFSRTGNASLTSGAVLLFVSTVGALLIGVG